MKLKKLVESVDWNYFDKFNSIEDEYLPQRGEGDTLATQCVTAICKLIYKWYNDGDIYDNTYHLKGWANDLSSYANWLYKYIDETYYILTDIEDCMNDSDYENLLKELADTCLNENFLNKYKDKSKQGSIYDCDGIFEFREYEEDDEEDWDEEDEEDW